MHIFIKKNYPVFNNLISARSITADNKHLTITNHLSNTEEIVSLDDYKIAKQMDGDVYPGKILETDDLDKQFEVLERLYDQDLIRLDNGVVKSNNFIIFKAFLLYPEIVDQKEGKAYQLFSTTTFVLSLIMLVIGLKLYHWQPVFNNYFSMGSFVILLWGGIFLCPLIYMPFHLLTANAYVCPIYEIGVCINKIFTGIYAFYDKDDVRNRFKIAQSLAISSEGALIIFGVCYIALLIPGMNELLAYLLSIFALSSLSFGVGSGFMYINSALEYILLKLIHIELDDPILLDKKKRKSLFDDKKISKSRYLICEFLDCLRSKMAAIPIGIIVIGTIIAILIMKQEFN